MNFSRLFFPFFGFALLTGVSPVRAAEPPTEISLETLVAEIVAKNPEGKFYAAEIDAAKAGRRSAAAWHDPELSVQGGHKRVVDANRVLAGEGMAWSISVSQNFEWPGRLALRKSIANRQIELAELGLARFEAELQARARVLAYALFAAEQKSVAAAEVAERYGALRELFLARDPAGITPLLETRVIEAHEIALRRRATAYTLAARSALVELNQLRGAPLDTEVDVAKTPLIFNRAPTLAELLTAARENNFELRQKKIEVEQQALSVSLARHERHPSFSVSPFVSHEKAAETEMVAGLGLSVPLPLGQRSAGGVDLAQARRRQAETLLLVAQRNLEREVISAAREFDAKLSGMTHWKSDSVEKFREAAALADRHYRLGAVPIGTYLELQNSYLDAVEALLDTQQEMLAAGQQLQLLTGLNFHAVVVDPAP